MKLLKFFCFSYKKVDDLYIILKIIESYHLQPEILTRKARSEESGNESSEQEADEEEVEAEEDEEDEDNEDGESNSVPSDWENIKVKVEKLSDAEASDTTEVSPAKVTSSKKKRKRRESWSSDTSSSSSSDSEDAKSKKRKRKRKRARKESTSESDSSDSSSSDTSSSEEVRKKKKRKASKKKKKKRKRMKKLSKKVKRKRKRKVSTDSSSSDSDDKPPKKRSKIVKAKKKKKNKAGKQNAELTPEKIKSKSSEGKKVIKIKEEKKSSTSKQPTVEPEDKQVQSPSATDNRNKRVSESTNSDWEKESIPRNDAKEPEESTKVSEDSKPSDTKKSDNHIDNKTGTGKSSKGQEKETEVTKTIPEEDEKTEEEPETKKIKKDKKKDTDTQKEVKEFDQHWDRDDTVVAGKDKDKFTPLDNNKPLIDWNNTDFDSLNVFSIHQLPHHVVDKRVSEIYANEWEVDSQEALPQPVSAPIKIETKLKKVEKVVYDKETDTYIPVEVETSKEKKKKDKRSNALRIWEDEQENAEREELMMTLEKKISTEPKLKPSKEPEGKFKQAYANKGFFASIVQTKYCLVVDTKIKEEPLAVVNEEKPRRKNRWDVEGHAEGFENAPSVNWEDEGNIWPTESSSVDKPTEVSFTSPLLDDDIKDDNAAIDIVDSPDTLRKKMEKIAMLERALIDKDISLSPTGVLQNLSELKNTMEVKDTLDLEPPNPNEIVS